MRRSIVFSILGLALILACAEAMHTRTPALQHNADIELDVVCMERDGTAKYSQRGSGVIIDRHHILTARHVVQCDKTTPVIVVDAGDQFLKLAQSGVELPESDVALLYVASGLPTQLSTTVEIGPKPHIGDEVCEAAAVPSWTYRCGIVQPEAFNAPADSDIRIDFKVEHGNSGAGLYDKQGRLVGIVTALKVCEYKDVCQGYAASLDNYTWLMTLETE